jgi:hypothetical protein
MEPEFHWAPMLIIRGNWDLLSSVWLLYFGKTSTTENRQFHAPCGFEKLDESVRDRSVAKNKSK